MKSETRRWFAPVAACLLILTVGDATAGPDITAEQTPAESATKPHVKAPVRKPLKQVKATQQQAASAPTAPAQTEATTASVPRDSVSSAVSVPLSPEQSAALARQRLRRCQLHPGTCEQSKGAAPESVPRQE